MLMPTIKYIRAFTLRGAGADYHDQSADHWIDDHISTPMAKYPQYRQSRQSFGLNVLGTLVVEVEASDGTVGFAVTTGGELGCWIVEKHLARFVEGQKVTDIEKIWDQMFNATLYYGRKGIVINAISGVDLALWDLLGKVRDEPVHALLGGPVRDELTFYMTGARPDFAKEQGFVGGKLPLHHGPAERDEGLKKNLELLADMRQKCGPDFWLMYDCWMSLDVDYATRLATIAHNELGLKWIEEALPPDDYWGYAELRDPCARDSEHLQALPAHAAGVPRAANHRPILASASSDPLRRPRLPTSISLRMTRAGLPATMLRGGTSSNTTAPAATIDSLAIVTPGITVAPPPIKQRSPIRIGRQPPRGSREISSVLNATNVSAPIAMLLRPPDTTRPESEIVDVGCMLRPCRRCNQLRRAPSSASRSRAS